MKPRFRYDHRRRQWCPIPARKGLGPSDQEAARERFVRQLNRLKAVLGVVEDQHVAVVLGMSKAAFSARKMRGAFPTNHVKALAIDAPDLHLDVSYVLEAA